MSVCNVYPRILAALFGLLVQAVTVPSISCDVVLLEENCWLLVIRRIELQTTPYYQICFFLIELKISCRSSRLSMLSLHTEYN